jgi:hypothetical protein
MTITMLLANTILSAERLELNQARARAEKVNAAVLP